MDLSGYVFEALREDHITVLYRGRYTNTAIPILVAAPLSSEVASMSLQRFEHELALSDQLNSTWAAKPIALVYRQSQPVLVLSDPGGVPLDRLIGQPMELSHFLKMAVGLTATIRQMHEHGLIHKDIKPANILVNEAGQVWLTGFGLASRLRRERPSLTAPQFIAGTLAYMAPEQTGRMNRSIDARSDLYSLGITLYEMLTGALPFIATDAMDWIHCHIARQPISLRKHMPDTPPIVEAIILKLLAKAAEDRYQTILAVEADFRRCLNQKIAHGHIDSFEMAENDRADRLRIPEILYGRIGQVDRLLTAYDRVGRYGQTEVVLVSGPAGIGKSTLVGELHQRLVSTLGLFASGKFDQYKRDIPYATVAEAFQGLIRQILTLDALELERWKRDLLEALGPNGQLLVNVIPDLALLIGDQPPAPDLPPQDAQSRFHRVFKRFLRVFTRPEHPLVWFIDDAQWLDAGTLELVGRLATDPEIKNLLLICAFRDNEIRPMDPVTKMLKAIRAERQLEEIHLGPLSPDEVKLFVAEALYSPAELVKPLADLIFARTGGNPFFVTQILAVLEDDELLVFDRSANTWRWDAMQIASVGITENVADLMTDRLTRLPAAALEAMKVLACLGNGVQLKTLSSALGHGVDDTIKGLWQAIRPGLILQKGDEYAFAHDRVQEAAYRLIPDAEKPATHLRIARALVLGLTPTEIEDRIFEIVDQFSRGRLLIHSYKERERAAKLHLTAAKRAKGATAYTSALMYLASGKALLDPRSWKQQYRLTFEFELQQAECEFLTGQHATAEKRLSALLHRARDLVDRASATCLLMALYTTLGDTDRAVVEGLSYLSLAGVEWSAHPTNEIVENELQSMNALLETRPIEKLIDLPRMDDATWLSVMEVLAWLILPALITDKNLEAVVLLRMANISLQHGNCDASCYAYSQINVVLGLRFGDLRSGEILGQLALHLVEHHGMDRFKARVYSCFNCFVVPWSEHLSTSLEPSREAVELATAVGDPVFMVAAYRSLVTNLLVSGADLAKVQHEAEQFLTLAQKTGFRLAADGATSVLQLIHELRSPGGLSAEVEHLATERRRFEQHLLDVGSPGILALAWYWIHRMQACYFTGDYANAKAAKVRAEEILDATRTFIDVAEYHFYGALILSGSCEIQSAEKLQCELDMIRAHYCQVSAWADHCPENFAARATLIAAEIARIENRDLVAIQKYEEAVRLARDYGFTQVEGVANELAARFHAARGLETAADAYLRGARSCYRRWGAVTKVTQIDRGCFGSADTSPKRATEAEAFIKYDQLDIAAVIEMSQAVSSEIVLDKLVERLMKSVVEHAGAVRGVLLLHMDGRVHPIAEAVAAIEGVVVHRLLQPEGSLVLPEAILNFVMRTHEPLILTDAQAPNLYSADPYIRDGRARSILCMPLLKQTQLIGMLYLENDLISDVFTPSRLSLLHILASQASISIENAQLFDDVQMAREHARQSANELRQSFDMIPALAWSSTPDGSLEFANERWHDFTGITREELTSDNWLSTYHPDDADKVIQKWSELLTLGISGEVEARMRRYDGAVRNFLVQATPVRDNEGRIVRWYGTNVDIDDIRRIAEAQERLDRAARVTAMGELTVSIAHEINQPLMAIVTNAATCLQWLTDDNLNVQRARQAAERIVRDGHRAGDVISSIRALAKKSQSEVSEIDINKVVLEMLVLMRGELHRKGIVAETDLVMDACILGDRIQMQQVFLNLIMNGIEAITAGKLEPARIRICTQLGELGYILVSVADTGIGLKPDDCEQIFEAFYTTKPDGIGMGLSICRSIIEAHGGRLWATPNLPFGSIFYFTLPTCHDDNVRI